MVAFLEEKPTGTTTGLVMSPVEHSLVSGEISTIENKGGGINTTLKTSNGVEGIFKTKKGEYDSKVRASIIVKTQYQREVGAYRMDKILGVDMVPPTVERNIPGYGVGSHQEFRKGFKNWSGAPSEYQRLVSSTTETKQSLFDYIVGAEDRHGGNFMVNSKGDIALIDNGLSMGSGDEIWLRVANNFKLNDFVDNKTTRDIIKSLSADKINLMKVELLDSKLINEQEFKCILSRINYMAKSIANNDSERLFYSYKTGSSKYINISNIFSTDDLSKVMDITIKNIEKMKEVI